MCDCCIYWLNEGLMAIVVEHKPHFVFLLFLIKFKQCLKKKSKQSHLSISTSSSYQFVANCWCRRETSPTVTVQHIRLPSHMSSCIYLIQFARLFAVLKPGHYFLQQNTSWISLSQDWVCRRNSNAHNFLPFLSRCFNLESIHALGLQPESIYRCKGLSPQKIEHFHPHILKLRVISLPALCR